MDIGEPRGEIEPVLKAPTGRESILGQIRNSVSELAPSETAAYSSLQGITDLAGSFSKDPTPGNFRSFVQTLMPAVSKGQPISEFASGANNTVSVWINCLTGDADLGARYRYYSPESLAAGKVQMADERAMLARNPISRVRHIGKIRVLDRRIGKANFYAETYETEVRPTWDKKVGMNNAVQEAVALVAKGMEAQKTNTDPGRLEAEIAKEDTLGEIDLVWLDSAAVVPFGKMRDKYVSARREDRQDYSDADLARDEEIFDNLSARFAAFVKTRIETPPKTREGWAQAYNERENGEEIKQFRNAFTVLGLQSEFNDIAYGMNLGSSTPPRGDYLEPADKEFDLRPRNAYKEWASALDSFLEYRFSPWRLEELEEALEDKGDRYDYGSRHLLENLQRGAEGVANGRKAWMWQTGDANALTKLPSFDRWPALKKYLADNGTVAPEKLDAFESELVNKLVYGVLVPGGHESWPGTDVCGQLSRLGSANALEPLLFYQTYISGAAGLYLAGHTNAVAQGTLEGLLRKFSAEEIEALDVPNFVKAALRSLKDFQGNLQEDSYGRSAVTATLVTRNFVGAAEEIKANWEKPGYSSWAQALLRGMRNSRQGFGKEAYEAAVSFIDLDSEYGTIQKEVVMAFASRISNRGVLGVEARINEDAGLAMETLVQLMRRSGFKKSIENINAISQVTGTLHGHILLAGYPQEMLEESRDEIQARGFPRQAIPSPEEIERDRQYQETIISRLEEWIVGGELTGEVKLGILKIFDYTGHDYPQTVDVAIGLYLDSDLAKYSESQGGVIHSGPFVIDTFNGREKWAHIEELTGLMMSRYLKFGDERAKDVIVETFVKNPSTRKGIVEFFNTFQVVPGQAEHQAGFQRLIEDFNGYLVGTDEDVARSVQELFDERIYYRSDVNLRDLVLHDVDISEGDKKSTLFSSMVAMVRNNSRFVGQEPPAGVDDSHYRFGQETVELVAQRMPEFLDSDSLYEQFWAVYTLNLVGDRGGKSREVLAKLLGQIDEVEKEVKGASGVIRKIKTDLDIEDASGGL